MVGLSAVSAFASGSLAQLPQNPLFVGKVKHRGELFEGEHELIIEQRTWEQVQILLATNRRERLHGTRVRSPSLLTGMIVDQDGRPMTPVFTTRSIRQHRYYVTRLKPGEDSKTAWRVPAGDIDSAVVGCVERTLTRRAAELGCPLEEPIDLDRCSVPEQRKILLENDVRVQLGSEEMVVSVGNEPCDHIEIPARLARRGNELKLVLRSDEAEAADPDPVLLKLVSHAALAQQAALTGEPDAIVSGYSKRHLWQLLRVSWLAPDIIAAITEGPAPNADRSTPSPGSGRTLLDRSTPVLRLQLGLPQRPSATGGCEIGLQRNPAQRACIRAPITLSWREQLMPEGEQVTELAREIRRLRALPGAGVRLR